MKLGPGDVAGLLRRRNPAVIAALVHGPDEGLVRETAEALVTGVVEDPRDPFRVADLTTAQLRDDPALLADEAAAMALTGGRRVVRVRGASDAVADLFASFLEAPLGDALIVVEAAALGSKSRLRLLFEAAGQAASIACYGDDGDRLQSLISSTLEDAGIQLTADARNLLLARLGGDRATTRNELEKLVLYGSSTKTVDADDVLAIVGDATDVTLDDLIYAVGDGDVPAMHRALDRSFAEGVAAVRIVRAAIGHFLRLQRAGAAVRAGASPDQAMARLRPPIFFKVRDRFRAQMTRWPDRWVEAALDRLLAAEIDCKTTALPERTIAARVLLDLTRAAAGRRSEKRRR